MQKFILTYSAPSLKECVFAVFVDSKSNLHWYFLCLLNTHPGFQATKTHVQKKELLFSVLRFLTSAVAKMPISLKEELIHKHETNVDNKYESILLLNVLKVLVTSSQVITDWCWCYQKLQLLSCDWGLGSLCVHCVVATDSCVEWERQKLRLNMQLPLSGKLKHATRGETDREQCISQHREKKRQRQKWDTERTVSMTDKLLFTTGEWKSAVHKVWPCFCPQWFSHKLRLRRNVSYTNCCCQTLPRLS